MANERRRHTRKRVDAPATVRIEGKPPAAAQVRDMSLSGAFVELDAPAAFGTKLALDIDLADGQRLTIEAVVRWSKPDGVGIHFGALGARETYLITELLAALEPVPDSRFPGEA